MSFTEYVDSVLRHAFYPGAGTTAGLTYAALGLAGEAGETANKVKKILRDAGGVISEERLQQIKDELGDVLWYVAACARELDVTLEDVARHNVEKLAARHGEKKDNVRHIRFPPHA
ncbi:MAG: nucleoside triphosphate pyrophosphohydrolase family protein [Pyrinomonadaceae bacterium]